MIHPRLSVNSLCFGQAPFAEMAAHWRALSARRIALTGTQLLAEPALAAALVTQDGMIVQTVAHVLHTGPLVPELVAELRERLQRSIDAAAAVGARSIYLLTGARGALDWEAAADLFCAIVGPCVGQAEAAGIRLLVENAPFLFADFHFVHSLRDAMTLARTADIGVSVDIFGCWAEAGLSALLRQAAPLVGLVQLSDHVPGDRSLPARAVPGDGAIPIEAIVRTLVDAGYGGIFDIELLGPRIDAEGHVAAVRRAADNIGHMFDRLGI